jgi:hypothetical protein
MLVSEALREYYSLLSTETSLSQLIAESVKEDLHLEFKTKKDSSQGSMDESDKRQFSRALSGFANSDGGILVWGIATDIKEQAASLDPIMDFSVFFSSLKKSLLNSTQPVVDNVLIDTVPSSSGANAGYVRCFIPQSDKAPHRAMLADREYYKRTTEGFYRLEHFDLEDMFGRRPHPSLTLWVQLIKAPSNEESERLIFSFSNEGRGVAKYAGFVCQFDKGISFSGSAGGLIDATSMNANVPTICHTENIDVIAPSGIKIMIGETRIHRTNIEEPLKIRGCWYCENMYTRTYEQTLTPTERSSDLGVAVFAPINRKATIWTS